MKFIVYSFGLIMLLVFCEKKDDTADDEFNLPPTGEGKIDQIDYPLQTPGYNWLIGTNAANGQVETYAPDVADWNHPDALKWSFRPSVDLGWSAGDVSLWNEPQNVRFRENEVHGGRCIAAAGDRLALIAAYPSGNNKWSADVGENQKIRCIELLPDGNLVVSACKGNWIRVYAASQGTDDSTFGQFSLNNASAILWDDKNKCLWVTGEIPGDTDGPVLTALSVEGTPASPKLAELASKRSFLPDGNECRDISPVIGNPDQLWVSCGNNLYIYRKTDKTFFPVSGPASHVRILHAGNQQDGAIAVIDDDGQGTSNTVRFYSLESFLSSQTYPEAKFTSLHPCNPNYTFRREYRVATYNIRSANIQESNPNRFWSNRNLLIQDMIKKYDFDIFGVQEAWGIQLNDLDSLKSYTHFGVGINGDNTRAHNNIFFKKARFKLLDKGTFWLSSNGPDVPTGPSWDAAQRRICTWGKLEDYYSAAQFFVFNTHFDHKGSAARSESAYVVLNKIPEIAGNLPVILMGDLNSDQNHPGFTILQESELLDDAAFEAEYVYSRRSTGNGYDPDISGERWIDHILFTSHWYVRSYNVLTDTYGEDRVLPSDHFPVLVEIGLK